MRKFLEPGQQDTSKHKVSESRQKKCVGVCRPALRSCIYMGFPLTRPKEGFHHHGPVTMTDNLLHYPTGEIIARLQGSGPFHGPNDVCLFRHDLGCALRRLLYHLPKVCSEIKDYDNRYNTVLLKIYNRIQEWSQLF